jgi:hypothetical protein
MCERSLSGSSSSCRSLFLEPCAHRLKFGTKRFSERPKWISGGPVVNQRAFVRAESFSEKYGSVIAVGRSLREFIKESSPRAVDSFENTPDKPQRLLSIHAPQRSLRDPSRGDGNPAAD